MLGGSDTDTSPWGAALTASDAHLIDEKIDDGAASTGNLYSVPSGLSGAAAASSVCVNNNYATSAGASYLLTDATISCRMLYWLNKL